MAIIEKLASSLGRRDEVPNQELANYIVERSDKGAVKELIENLSNNKKDIQHDCIKTLYEIGGQKPSLIAAYAGQFIQLLDSENNRMQWGAMTALNAIAAEKPEAIYPVLPKLEAIADKGSVITRDNYVAILIKLCAIKKYAEDAFALLNGQLLHCPTNQLPMYAENALPIIEKESKDTFINTLSSRLNDFEKESKRRRVEKVLKAIQKNN